MKAKPFTGLQDLLTWMSNRGLSTVVFHKGWPPLFRPMLLCCGCAWRRPFVSLVDEAGSEAEVLNSIFISYTNANHAATLSM